MIPDPNDSLLIAGIIGSARGLKGEVNVQVRTDRPEEVFEVGAILRTDSEVAPELVISLVRSHNDRLLLCFEGFTTREDVEVLRGAQLLVEPQVEDDAWYEHDLKGLKAVNLEGTALGEVTGLMASPAHDLLVVDAHGTEVLVPFVEEIVPEVLIDEGQVVLDPPLGLFPEPADPGPADPEPSDQSRPVLEHRLKHPTK